MAALARQRGGTCGLDDRFFLYVRTNGTDVPRSANACSSDGSGLAVAMVLFRYYL